MDILVHSLVKNCLVLTTADEHQKLPPHEVGPKMDFSVHSLVKNCLVLTKVDEHQKLPPREVGPKNGHLSTQFSKELPCVHHS